VTIIETKKNLHLHKEKLAYCCKLNIEYLLLYTCTNGGPPGVVTINNNIYILIHPHRYQTTL